MQKVVHGKYKGSVDVAVKMLKESTMSEEEFAAEANTMTSVSLACFSHLFSSQSELFSARLSVPQRVLDSVLPPCPLAYSSGTSDSGFRLLVHFRAICAIVL